MTTFRLRRHHARSSTAIILGLIALIVYSGGGAHSALAAPVQAVPAQAITIPAGGSAALQVRGFAMQPGSTVPQGALALAQPSFPSDRIRITLFYGIDWGYTETNPDQVAQAIWYAQTGSWQSQDHTIAERIANAAAGAPGLPFWNVDGQSLLTLATQGRVTISPLSLTEGQGTLTLSNTTGQDILAYLPYGTLFSGAGGSVVVWATGAGQTPNPTATAQVAPPTAAATQPPTQAPEATATPTSQSYVKPGTTPPAQASETATSSPTVKSEATNTPEQDPADLTATATATVSSRSGTIMPPVPAVEPATQTPVPPAATATPTTAPYEKSGTGNSTALPASPTESRPAATAANTPQAVARAAGSGAQSAQQTTNSSKNSNEVPAVKASAPANAPAPPPVATAVGQATGVPGAVNTSEPQVPNPQLTQVSTVAPAKQPTFTPALKPTFTPSPVSPTNQGNDTGKATPTPIAKPPVPAPTPLPPSDPGTGPTIIVSGTPGTPPSDGGATGTKAPVPPVQGNVGTPPNNNPNTGGGQSTLPAWLSLFSALMLVGGWALRRMSNAPLPATAEVKSEDAPETLN